MHEPENESEMLVVEKICYSSGLVMPSSRLFLGRHATRPHTKKITKHKQRIPYDSIHGYATSGCPFRMFISTRILHVISIYRPASVTGCQVSSVNPSDDRVERGSGVLLNNCLFPSWGIFKIEYLSSLTFSFLLRLHVW